MSVWQTLLGRVASWLGGGTLPPAPPIATPQHPATPAAGPELVVAVAAELARRFEGLFLAPYLCPAGVPSIGYGATYYEDGTRVTLADAPITRERAEELMLWMVRTVYLPAVLRLFPGVTDPYLLAALTDFCFNLGEPNLRASTLRRKVLAEEWDAVPHEFMRWVNAGGRKLRGLVLRRQAEVATWEGQGKP